MPRGGFKECILLWRTWHVSTLNGQPIDLNENCVIPHFSCGGAAGEFSHRLQLITGIVRHTVSSLLSGDSSNKMGLFKVKNPCVFCEIKSCVRWTLCQNCFSIVALWFIATNKNTYFLPGGAKRKLTLELMVKYSCTCPYYKAAFYGLVVQLQ